MLRSRTVVSAPLNFYSPYQHTLHTKGFRDDALGRRVHIWAEEPPANLSDHLRAYRKNGIRSNVLLESLRYAAKVGEIATFRTKSALGL